MPYKPLNISTFKIDAKVASILKIGQQEYQKTLGVNLIDKEIKAITNTPKNVEVTTQGKKISEIVFDFLFEPKYDNMLAMFSKKAS